MRHLWILIAVLVVAILLVVALRYRSPSLNLAPDAASEIDKAKRR